MWFSMAMWNFQRLSDPKKLRLLLWHLGREDLQGQSGKVTGKVTPQPLRGWKVGEAVKPNMEEKSRITSWKHLFGSFFGHLFGIFGGLCGYVKKKNSSLVILHSTNPNVQWENRGMQPTVTWWIWWYHQGYRELGTSPSIWTHGISELICCRRRHNWHNSWKESVSITHVRSITCEVSPPKSMHQDASMGIERSKITQWWG